MVDERWASGLAGVSMFAEMLEGGAAAVRAGATEFWDAHVAEGRSDYEIWSLVGVVGGFLWFWAYNALLLAFDFLQPPFIMKYKASSCRRAGAG